MAEGDRAENHPSPAELDRFLLGEMSPRQAAPVLAHLLKGCEICQRRLEPMAMVMFGTGERLPETGPETGTGAEYDFPLFKAFASARRFAAATAQAKAGARHSAPPPLKEAPPFAHGEEARRDWTLCQALLESCRTLRSSDPETMVMTARLAVTLAERLDTASGFGTEALADLRARAWAELGNAHRVSDDLAGAESELSRALELAAQGTNDPLLLARVMDLTASLYTDQRRFDESLRLLDMVYAIYERAGDRHAAGRALISKGVTTGYAFDVEESVRLLSQGLRMIDPTRDPKLVMVGIHNLIWCLVECGQAPQADLLFAHSRALFSSYVERLDAIKFAWLEGRIAAALREDERAESRFQEARASFEEIRLPYDVALVSLDMAALRLRAGRTAEIKDLIDGTIEIFRARKIRREAIAMLLMVREAFQKDQITEALLRTAATELLRLADSPARRSRVSD